MTDMPKPRPPYLHRFVTRHGKVKWYFRKRGEKAIHIPGEYGSKPFMAAYMAAASGAHIQPVKSKSLTIAWCIGQYMESPQWQEYAGETRKQISYQFSRVVEKAGDSAITAISHQDILAARLRRAGKPSDANKYVRAMQMLCKFCVSRKWLTVNPAAGIPKLKTGTGEGFYTWLQHDFIAFEARWTIGTQERLAYEIIVCTGIRRGDIRKFGAQHIRGNRYAIRTSKTGALVEGNLSPRLKSAILATDVGDMVFLHTSLGKPFRSAASFGNWFGDACKAAGIPGNAHGVRKGIASIAAEGGMTEAQLNSFFGWSHGSKESAVYIAKASRAKMSVPVGSVIAQTLHKPKTRGQKAK